MSEIEPQPFTFVVLDGLGFAAQRGRLQPVAAAAYAATDLGPVLELARLSADGLLPAPTRATWLDIGEAAAFGVALRRGGSSWTCPFRKMGFYRLGEVPPQDETKRNGFHLEAQKAAKAVGFPRQLAAQLVGALCEIEGNVYEHSEAPVTGLAAYRATARSFEFVVSDGGIGVLASLASGPDYRDLTDHAEALRLMLTEGVSRYGKSAKRGNGFRPLFQGLANVNGTLRFHSGDQALTMEGVNTANIPWKPAEKPTLRGLVASVICSHVNSTSAYRN
jgi:anti-sigma regulatory factor (Ser/Thr protein kinase)